MKEYSIWELTRRNASLYPDRTAYIFDDIPHTWKDVENDSSAIAILLSLNGVRHGSHVAIWGVNSYDWVITMLACLKLGAVCVLANYSYQAHEIKHVLNEGGAAEFLIIGEPKDGLSYDEIIQELGDQIHLKKIKHMSCLMDSIPSIDLNDYQAEITAMHEKSDPDDTALIIFTSGTTKAPKGVMLSNRNIFGITETIAQEQGWTKDDIQLITLPMYHGSGANACVFTGIQAAVTSVIMRYYASVPVMEAIQRYKVTAFNVVPALLLVMMNHKDFNKYDLSTLKSGVWSGAGITRDNFLKVSKVFDLRHVKMAYGQTEASTLSTMSGDNDCLEMKMASCGKPLPGVEMRIFHPGKKMELGAGMTGEIQINGCTKMQGYFNLQEENAGKFEEDGWMKTGDLGYMDVDGNLYFVGRMSEMIVRGGENISPAEIEDCIQSYGEMMDQIFVTGVKSDVMNEEIAAFYTASETVDAEKIRAYIASKLAKFKVPRYICQMKEFPMNDNGKIDKRKLKRLAENMGADISEDLIVSVSAR